MKILFVGRNCQVGGGCTFRYRASLGLVGRGHQVFLAAQGGEMVSQFQAAGVRFGATLPTPFNRWQLKNLIKREGFDMIHACNSSAGDDVAWVAERLDAPPPWVMSVHGVLPPSVRDASANVSFTRAHQLICFDRFALQSLQNLPGLERTVLHVARPVETRPAASPGDPPHFAMVSRLSKTKGKGALAAIDAIDSLQNEFPGLSLQIVGAGSLFGDVKARCEAVNGKHGKALCQTLGALTDPFPVMAQAVGVVGTAYVALEALFHEIPVVAVGYQGYGIVTPQNLEEAISCNFGDSWFGEDSPLKPITCALIVEGFRSILTHSVTPEGRADLQIISAQLRRKHSLDAVAKSLEDVYTLARQKS